MNKKLTLFIILNLTFLIFNSVKAQAPNWAWAKGAGGNIGSSFGYSSIADSLGNI